MIRKFLKNRYMKSESFFKKCLKNVLFTNGQDVLGKHLEIHFAILGKYIFLNPILRYKWSDNP